MPRAKFGTLEILKLSTLVLLLGRPSLQFRRHFPQPLSDPEIKGGL
jgi:hypothetical protein